MDEEVGRINLGLDVNKQYFNKQLSGLANSSKQSIMSSFKPLGKLIGTTLGIAAVVSFTKSCLELGSNLAEVQNVVDTVFTSMNGKVNTFAKNAMEQFGLSETVAKKYMGTLGAMSKSMGFTESASYAMAEAVTSLSGDVASFYNITSDEAYTKLKSIWTGETETLKELGVIMTQTNLDQYALNNGFGKTTAKMTEQEKVMLRYQYVMSSLSDSQGDFAKTQDSWANQVRILSLRFDSLKATLGQGFINLFTPIIKAINLLIGKLQVLADKFVSFTQLLFGNKASSTALSAITSDASDATDAILGIGDSTEEAVKTAERALAGFDQIDKLSDDTNSISSGLTSNSSGNTSVVDNTAESNEIGILKSSLSDFEDWCKDNFGLGIKSGVDKVIKSFKKMGAALGDAWKDIKTLVEPLKKVLNEAIKVINKFIKLATSSFSRLLDTLTMVFEDIWDVAAFPILSKFVQDGIPMLLQFTDKFIDLMDKISQKAFDAFDSIWKDAAVPLLDNITKMVLDIEGILSDFWNKYGEDLFNKMTEAVDNFADNVSAIWDNILKPILDTGMDALSKLWEEHIKPLLSNAMDAIGEIASCLLDLWNKTLSPLITWLVETFGPIFASAFKQVYDVARSVFGGICDVVSDIITTIKGIVQFISGVFTGDWEKAWEGVKNIFKGVWDSLVDIAKVPINLIIDLINGLTRAFTKGINTVIKGINHLSIDIPDWVPGIGGETLGFNIGQLDAPTIPHLANGGYAKPNTPQLAMIGDNRHQGEVVAPEDKLTQLAKDAVAMSNAGNLSSEIMRLLLVIIDLLNNWDKDVYLDGVKVTDLIVSRINKNTRRNGVCEIIT